MIVASVCAVPACSQLLQGPIPSTSCMYLLANDLLPLISLFIQLINLYNFVDTVLTHSKMFSIWLN